MKDESDSFMGSSIEIPMGAQNTHCLRHLLSMTKVRDNVRETITPGPGSLVQVRPFFAFFA